MFEKQSSLSTRQQSKFIHTHRESIEDCSLQRASDKKNKESSLTQNPEP